jgi:outer membrane protein assembly factor BamA
MPSHVEASDMMRIFAPLAALMVIAHPARGQTSTSATSALDIEAFDERLLEGQAEVGDVESKPGALFVEAIEIIGNDKTSDQVILRRILLEVGDLVDDDKIEESRLRLLGTGFFTSVDFSLRRGSKRGRALLVVEVAERNTILVDELYLGFSPVAPIFGGVGVAESNFLGRGVTTAGGFVVGKDRRSFGLRFFVPDLSNTPLQLSGSAIFLQGAEVLDQANPKGDQLHYQRLGGTLGVGIGVGPSQRVSLTYRLESVAADRLPNLEPRVLRGAPSIQFDDSILSTLSLTYERDTRDDPFVAGQGHRIALGVELSTSLIGSSYEFSKYTAEYQHAFTLFGSHSLVISAFGGLIQGGAPFFSQFFISDYAFFAIGRDSLPRNAELNFSESNDYDDLIISAGLTYNVPIQSGGSLLVRTYVYGGARVSATASLDEIQEDPKGRGAGGEIPVSFDLGLKFDTFVGNFTLSLAYIVDLVI